MSRSVLSSFQLMAGVSASSLALLIASGYAAPAAAQDVPSSLVIVCDNIDAPDCYTAPDTAPASAVRTNAVKTNAVTPLSIKKVVNGQYAAQVDNGWVIIQGFQTDSTLEFYNTDNNGAFSAANHVKLRGNGGGPASGFLFTAGGIVFAPCPVGQGFCAVSGDGSSTGIGLGFGQTTVGGPGGEAPGWISDDMAGAHFTNPNSSAGMIVATAVDSVNGAWSVGWDTDTAGVAHAIAIKLDSAGQTYAPVAETDLGTLGGATSQALGISKGSTYIAGIAANTFGKEHAVYTTTPGLGTWVDIGALMPASKKVIKSKAVVANDAGYIAGTATVKRAVAGRNTSVDIGFVYKVGDPAPVFYEFSGANIVPQIVMADGSVIGNLEFVLPKGTSGVVKSNHPFKFDGVSNVTDYGVMGSAYGCRSNRPNHLGQIVGSCVPDSSTLYGVTGTPFYLDTTVASPAFLDLNATIHAKNDTSTPLLRPYALGTATSIDDLGEITLIALQTQLTKRAALLASKSAYLP